MSAIGFITKKESKKEDIVTIKKEDAFIQFDSGQGITLNDINHHVLVLGTTGSGKTTNVVLPGLSQLVKSNYAGLVIDIKGNMREKIRSIAKAHAREEDIVEFGTAESAKPVNLLENLEKSQVHELLKSFLVSSFNGKSNNLDFHMKGVSQAVECVVLLRFIAEKYPEFEATLSFVAQMITDSPLASSLFEFFIAKVKDPSNAEHVDFECAVLANNFHVFHYNKMKKRSLDRYFEQLNYALEALRVALEEVLQVPGIEENFCKAGADGVDMKDIVLKNKILLLRFGADSGEIGAKLSRNLIESYYKAIYELGVEISSQHPSFVCIDEFQEVADLSSARFSDMKFISQAREFRAAFIASTQSVSALCKEVSAMPQVDSFVSNCNNRVIFYSDDPKTQELVNRHSNEIKLNTLEVGQAFVAKYNSENRTHKQELASFQNIYEEVKLMIEENTVPKTKEVKPKKNKSLKSIYTEANSSSINKKEPETMVLKNETTSIKSKTRSKAQNTKSEPLADFLLEEPYCNLLHHDKEFGAVKNQKRKEKMDKIEASFMEKILKEFPQFFTVGDINTVDIPKGWETTLRKAILAMKENNLSLKIEKIVYENGKLQITSSSKEYYIAEAIFNRILAEVKDLCSLCGEFSENENRYDICVCDDCLKKYSGNGKERKPSKAKIKDNFQLFDDADLPF